jgi:hypothetical protein
MGNRTVPLSSDVLMLPYLTDSCRTRTTTFCLTPLCVYVYVCMCIYVCTYVRTYVYVRMYVYMYECVCVCIYVCASVCTYVRECIQKFPD